MNEVQKFYDAVVSDETLKAKLSALEAEVAQKEMSKAEAEAFVKENVLPIAKEAGFDLTLQDLESCEFKEGELSEAELAEAAGGGCGCVLVGLFKGSGCVGIGAGNGCGCVGIGLSQLSE